MSFAVRSWPFRHFLFDSSIVRRHLIPVSTLAAAQSETNRDVRDIVRDESSTHPLEQHWKMCKHVIAAEIFCFETFVPLKVVPDNDDLAFEMFVQLIKHIRHLGGLGAAGKCCREESHVVTNRRDRNDADGRKMSPFFRLDKNVRRADR